MRWDDERQMVGGLEEKRWVMVLISKGRSPLTRIEKSGYMCRYPGKGLWMVGWNDACTALQRASSVYIIGDLMMAGLT